MSKRETLLGVSSAEFRDFDVSRCRVQTADQRFGDGSADIMKARDLVEMQMLMDPHAEDVLSDSDSDSGAQGEAIGGAQPAHVASKPARRKPPKLQNLRMNLTALSQVYNLYFAAYRGKIWVYCPVGPLAQGLGEDPALVISHAVSPIGAHIPGRIAGWTPEEANHMIVGFLGDVEILLLCFENGDVEAYYTREIAASITHHPGNPGSASRPPPRPFFVANVGESAWGLAIHSKSRLIAVSSNRFEVTVFAFALTCASPPGKSMKAPHTPFEAAVLARKRNWRIVLPVKRNGHNIPNIDFVNSPHGHAQKISAVDMHGNIWLLDIWRQGTAPALIIPQDIAWGSPEPQKLWAVVALTESSFLDLGKRKHVSPKAYFSSEASHTRAIALGNGAIAIQLPFRNSRYWIDASRALTFIQDSRFTGRTQPYTLYNDLPLPSLFTDTPLMQINADNQDNVMGEEGSEDSTETENDDDEGDDDESDHDEGDDEDQPDDEEDELDDGEYDEGDLEVEVSSSGDDPIDQDNIMGAAYQWSLNQYTGDNVSHTASHPLLESYLPNEMDQPYEHSAVSSNNVNLEADAQKRLDVASKTQSSGLADQSPQGATEQLEGKVDGQSTPRMGMIYAPHKSMTYREPASTRVWASWLRRQKEFNTLSTEQGQAEIARVTEHTSFFVTDEADLRLITPNRRFVDILCRGPAGDSFSTDYSRVRRVNMTLHVPELNLVVAACQSGRVALVSLIKSPWALPTACGDRSVRVDKILPTVSEEDERKVRPKVSLFGIAMGPVQEVEDGTLRLRSRKTRASFSPKYRLILHYRDHTILSYLVSRPSPDDLQVV